VHLKDLAVSLADKGFQMAEVPLGQGVLPLEAMVKILRAKAPRTDFYLEMITRDPLLVPCLE
jgi:L-ribulose-5-phosphate 3-epimerase UlaE